MNTKQFFTTVNRLNKSVFSEVLIQGGRAICTDLDVQMSQPFNWIDPDAAPFVAPFDLLYKITRKADLSSITYDGQIVKVTTDAGRVFTAAYSGEPLQIHHHLGGLDPMQFSTFAELHKMSSIVSTDELRPAMCGVYFDHNHIVATDGHMLRWIADKDNTPRPAPFILPSVALKFLPKNDQVCELRADDRHASFAVYETEYVFHLITGRYPDYNVVIPPASGQTTKSIIDRASFLDSLDMALIAANPVTNQCIVCFNSGVILSAEDRDRKTAYTDTLRGIYSGEELRIGLNAKLMQAVLKLSDSEDVCITASTPNRAIIVDGCNLVMPVMLWN